MHKMMAGWTAAIVVLASAGALVAHHSLSQFDTTTAVRVKGTIVLFQLGNPHSILIFDELRADGQTQRWAVEGPGPGSLQLARTGIDFKKALKAGDIIEACGYVTKPGVESQRTISTEPISLSLKATTPKSISGKLMDGELLVMPDGHKQVWSDYGHHKCLGADYQDFHVK